MASVSPRLVIVQECVSDIWKTRGDGRGHWVALERALIEMLAPKRPERRRQQRRSNVIVLSDYLDERRRRERRTP